MIKVYHYPKCTTCKRALKWLKENNVECEKRDIKEQPPVFEEMKEIYKKSGLPLKKFFNTSGLLYKSLHLKEKLPGMSEEEMYRLLSSDGMLVKRPLVIAQNKILVGFKEKEWEDFLDKAGGV